MADLRSTICGIKSPNPFWLASAPPTDKEYNVVRAFKAGWGGVVWKTLGEDPPIVNVNGPRYGAIFGADRRLLGFNNIELITDRPLEINLQEIKKVKRDWPDRALVVSLMVPCEESNWNAILKRVEETGADGVELNFGCPHGMSERGMGSAVGQVPEYIEMVARWVKQHSRMPVLRQAHAQHHRHPLPGAGRQARRRRRGVGDQHRQLDHRRRSRSDVADSDGRRQGHPRRLLRPGDQADRAPHGRRDRPRRRDPRHSDLGNRWHHHLARRRRIPGARRHQCAGLHRRHDLRLQDGQGDDIRPLQLDGRQGLPLARPADRPRHRRTSPTGSTSTSTTSPRRRSIRISASSAAVATSSARTPRIRRSPRWSTASAASK